MCLLLFGGPFIAIFLQIRRILNLSNLILIDFIFTDLLILTRRMLLAWLVEFRRFRMEFFGKILLQDSKKLQVKKYYIYLIWNCVDRQFHRCTRGGAPHVPRNFFQKNAIKHVLQPRSTPSKEFAKKPQGPSWPPTWSFNYYALRQLRYSSTIPPYHFFCI